MKTLTVRGGEGANGPTLCDGNLFKIYWTDEADQAHGQEAEAIVQISQIAKENATLATTF